MHIDNCQMIRLLCCVCYDKQTFFLIITEIKQMLKNKRLNGPFNTFFKTQITNIIGKTE